MTRAVAYLRVSSDAQAEADRNSLPLQESAVRARAAERGYELGEVFTDVMSGRKVARPAYQRMLASVRAGDVDVILVTWLDRFGRNDREITMRVLELQDAGVSVEPTEEQIPDFITLVLSAWKAGQEVQRISDRTSDGLIASARRGVNLGNAPFGYDARWDYLPNGKKTGHRFEINELEATWVRFIFDQYVHHNRSLRWLAIYLNSNAPKANGRNWTNREVNLILRRQRYVGDWTYSTTGNARRQAEDIVVPGALPAIVDRDLFAAAVERLDVKAALGPGRTQTSTVLLAGLVKCAHCGGPIHGSRRLAISKDGRSRRDRYSCNNHHRLKQCEFANNHDLETIDLAVLGYLADIAGNIEHIREEIGERSSWASRALLDVNRQLRDVDAKFEQSMRLFLTGSIANEDQLASTNRILADEKRQLDVERDRLLTTITGAAERQRDVGALPEQMPLLIDASAPMAERKAILQRYIARVELTEGSNVPRIYPRFME